MSFAQPPKTANNLGDSPVDNHVGKEKGTANNFKDRVVRNGPE
jgi:hypothetical protein